MVHLFLYSNFIKHKTLISEECIRNRWDLFKKRDVFIIIILLLTFCFLHIFFQDFPKLNIVGWKMVYFCLTFHQNTFTRSNQCPAPMLATIDVTPKIVWAPLFPKRSSSRWHVRNLFCYNAHWGKTNFFYKSPGLGQKKIMKSNSK